MACRLMAQVAGNTGRLLLSLLAFAAVASASVALERYPSEAVLIRPKVLPAIGRVIVKEDQPASITLEAVELSV